MACGCSKPSQSPLWTPVPEFQQPTDILPGENIDCYMKRANAAEKNAAAEKIPGKIDNTAVVTDLTGKVDETFVLTPGSQVVNHWTVTADGQDLITVLPELLFSQTTGHLTGAVTGTYLNKNYKLLVSAVDDLGGTIDSREYNFFPKVSTKDDTVKFIFPLPGGVVTCKFGPRKPPAPGATHDHQGIDIALPGNAITDIVCAADGTVTRCGPGSGWGNVIMVEHRDGQDRLVATTVYGHWADAYVTVGQKVAAGQKIAREGAVGIGTRAHLHFELHKGPFRNPVDPIPYLNGNFDAANNNLPGEYGVADPATISSVSGSNRGMTAAESSQTPACPDALPNQSAATSSTNPEPGTAATLPPGYKNIAPNRSACANGVYPTADQVLSKINQAITEAGLTADDRKFLIQVATIESNLDPFAKNPTSSATGLYQMLDAIAAKYFGEIGVTPSCANRCDPYLATKAMIRFYQEEFLPYYAGWNTSGKTKIGGKNINPTAWSTQYPNFTQGEFMYGLIHHDGVGNAVAGIDRQGVDYWRKKIRGA